MKRRGFLFGLMAAPGVVPLSASAMPGVDADAVRMVNRMTGVLPPFELPVVRDWSKDPRFLRWIEELRHFEATDRDQEQLVPLLAASEVGQP